jgi:hypothetical protein
MRPQDREGEQLKGAAIRETPYRFEKFKLAWL